VSYDDETTIDRFKSFIEYERDLDEDFSFADIFEMIEYLQAEEKLAKKFSKFTKTKKNKYLADVDDDVFDFDDDDDEEYDY
jgi:hypothetical protein